jgi:trehalose-6-phosphatase
MRKVVASKSFRELWPPIMRLLEKADPKKHVVVFDIDATILYNVRDGLNDATPNFKVQMLYDLARRRKIPVYFVTARIGLPDNRRWTVRQLANMGFDWYQGLYMRGAQHRTSEQIAAFKADARRQIEQETRKKVILNVGDQWTDHVIEGSAQYDQLERNYHGQHVIFSPRDNSHTLVALKLYETQD